ncbi:hypothetical protein U1Q18_047491 [Sarracenia purpurea var. burkii]
MKYNSSSTRPRSLHRIWHRKRRSNRRSNGAAAVSSSIGGTPDLNTRFAGSSEEASVSQSQASASSGAYAGSSASAGVGSPSGFRPAGPGGRPDYDRIFNIPISALKSVNDFLNG